MCRSILIELGLGLPEKKDIKGLFAAVRKPLGLATDRTDLDPLIADDVRKILSGLATVVEGAPMAATPMAASAVTRGSTAGSRALRSIRQAPSRFS